MGLPMARMLGSMGISRRPRAGGDAHENVVAAVDAIASPQANRTTDQGAAIQGQDAG